MHWQFWQSSPPEKLSDQIQKALTTQFRVGPEAMGDMRILSRRGQFSNRKVELIRIFDPTLIEAGHEVPLTYRSMQEVDGHHRGLLFEGHIEKDNFGGRIDKKHQIHLTDLRSN